MANLFCAHWEPFSETWPTSGTMRNGQVFERPMPERHTIGSESLSSLSVPTPTVSDVYFEGYERTVTKASPNRGVGLPLWAERIRKLPTPKAGDAEFASGSTSGRPVEKSTHLATQVLRVGGHLNHRLLRTPTAAEVEGGPVSPEVAKAKGQTLRLTGQLLSLTEWGEFEPAIRRWEAVTGNDAPEPTLPDGQKGQHRLNSRFTEWMMGLAPGWITGHGLSRKDEIKMAGNGVVPQQAVFALSVLLERLERSK